METFTSMMLPLPLDEHTCQQLLAETLLVRRAEAPVQHGEQA
jgi:hypothetical protein